jgi:hypothetical protein
MQSRGGCAPASDASTRSSRTVPHGLLEIDEFQPRAVRGFDCDAPLLEVALRAVHRVREAGERSMFARQRGISS